MRAISSSTCCVWTENPRLGQHIADVAQELLVPGLIEPCRQAAVILVDLALDLVADGEQLAVARRNPSRARPIPPEGSAR